MIPLQPIELVLFMLTLATIQTPPQSCTYLPEKISELEYRIVRQISKVEYTRMLNTGWRRFGHSLFHPVCQGCRACLSLRVLVDKFQANRSQRRAQKANEDVRLEIGRPSVSEEKLALYDKYHSFQIVDKGWPDRGSKDEESYIEGFVNNPFLTEEWTYYIEDRLVSVSYIDVLPTGLSAIYCFYDPEERDRSLGTFNVLCAIDEAIRRELLYVYLGYYVGGCRSLEYKARFKPNQIIDATSGLWVDFQNL